MRLISRRSFLRAAAASAGAIGLAGLGACSSPEASDKASNHSARNSLIDASSINEPFVFPISFVVMSDTHVSTSRAGCIEHFSNALADIKMLEANLSTIVIVGDITDSGTAEQYSIARSLCEEAGFDYAHDFVKVMGNHDQCSDNFDLEKVGWDEQYVRFMNEAGVSSVYYDCEVAGQHFICLGPDRAAEDWTRFNFSDTQMNWLNALLDEDERVGKMSYVFCHMPLTNTLRNTEEWSWAAANSIIDEDGLRLAIASRRNLIFFSGHTHMYPDIAQPDPDGPLYVNDGAVGPGQISPDNMDFPDGFTGSFGWLVSVFENRVEFKARDFLQHAWIDELDHVLFV